MNFGDQVVNWIESDSERMDALEYASTLDLDEWCLAAGFVRNLIWDKLHDKAVNTPLNDIDLIYYSSELIDDQTDLKYEARLKSLSDSPWSVKNQARMHLRNDDQPYKSTSDAMSYWVEIETAVGATFSSNKGISIIAPFGLEANFKNTITLNMKRPKPKTYLERISNKKWRELWPKLELIS